MAETEQTTIRTVTTSEPEPRTTLFSSIIAIVGLIILIVVVIWGLIHLAGLSKSWFSSLFARPAASITLTMPASATSRVPFTMSWSYKPTVSGAYAFLYQCETGFQFEVPDASGVSEQVPCGASFMLSASTTALSLTPVFSGTNPVTVPVSLVFIPTATSTPSIQGSGSIVINPATKTTTTVSTPTATVTTSPAKPHATGPADLSVRIISVSADQYGNGIAVFDIANVGSGSSGSYSFEAQLPTSAYAGTYGSQQSYTYDSPTQSSLAPGDHVTSTLRFTQAQSGGIFSVTVDPSSRVNDSNRTNNYAYQTLTMPYNYTYNQQYNYQQPYYTY